MSTRQTWQIANTKNGTWYTMPSPKPQGITITDEPVWSSDTGRLPTTGKMYGHVVAWKTTVDMDFPPLSFEDSKLIRDKIVSFCGKGKGSGFFYIRYKDFDATSWTSTLKVYSSNLPRTIYCLDASCRYHQDVKLQFVEQ